MTLQARARRFTRTAPIGLVAAGLLLMAQGGALLQSNWAPGTLALTHLVTLGFLSIALMGLVYGRTAAFAGAQIPGPRSVESVYVFMLIGVASLVGGLLSGAVWPLFVSLSALVLAVPIFAVSLLRVLRGVRGSTSAEVLRVALWSLLISAAIGIWMLHGHAGMLFPGGRPLWVQVHLSVALLGWFGGLFASLSGTAPTRIELGLLVTGVVLPPAVLLVEALQGLSPPVAAVAAAAAAPAAIAVWGVSPLRALRVAPGAPDAGRDLWRAGFALAPGVGVAGLLAVVRDAPEWNLVFGWIAVWGWAGLVVHGLLLRGVRAGLRLPALGLALHVATLGLGVVATMSGVDGLARLSGLGLGATGVCLFVALQKESRQK